MRLRLKCESIIIFIDLSTQVQAPGIIQQQFPPPQPQQPTSIQPQLIQTSQSQPLTSQIVIIQFW